MPYPDRHAYPDRFYIPWWTASRGSRALELTKGTPTKLVVNDYWRVAVVAEAKHLHLGQEDLVDADLNAIRDAGLTLGLSPNDDPELETPLCAKPGSTPASDLSSPSEHRCGLRNTP